MAGWTAWPLTEAGAAGWGARESVRAMTQAAECAVIAPRDPGGFPRDWRRAVAARIARLNGQEALAGHYGDGLADPGLRAIAVPGGRGRDAREVEVLRFMDAVARAPKDVEADDLARLQAAGVTDADIVRLCELNAFLGYQARVVAGLALLAGRAA